MHILLNNMILLNSKYDRKEVLKKQRKKFYLVKDKKALMMNWSFLLWRRHDFFGLEYSHLASSYLKSTYEQVWRENEQILDRVCRNKFRSAEDILLKSKLRQDGIRLLKYVQQEDTNFSIQRDCLIRMLETNQ